MKIRFLLVIAVSAIIAWLSGCANPTQPDKTTVTKNMFAALTSSLEHEVASLRGKSFKRSIAITVYTKEEYHALVAGQISSLSADKRAMYNKICQCEGLMRPNTDYFADYDSAMSNMTGGFYEDGKDSINIVLQDNSTGPSADDSITIFHELVHAMQDQYFDLSVLENNVASSDQHYAFTYVVEGEAELLCIYYSYKMYFGYYPSSPSPVMDVFTRYHDYAEAMLDSMHRAGQPLFLRQPLLWAYYSYGPRFIDTVAGMNWSVIDNTIFASLPVKSAEVMNPSTYVMNRTEYLLDDGTLKDYIDSSNVPIDDDELGEVLICVMMREWDIGSSIELAQGLLADRVHVFRDLVSDSLRLAWCTVWRDSATAAAFMANYAGIVQKKKSITLPLPARQNEKRIIDDSLDRVYIEQDGAKVFTLQDYPPSMFAALVDKMRAAKPYLRSLAKTALQSARPFVDKSILAKGVWHGFIPPARHGPTWK